MVSRGSKKVVYAGIVANLAIAGCKYVAAALTKSSAMTAEAVHSTVDTGNELLLLLGMKRSNRPADALHPYGHGKVVYFYSLLVAVYIFTLGGGLAVYRGFSRLRHPVLFENLGWNYAVLGAAFLFEFYSWQVSYRALRRRKDAEENVFDEIVGSKDPTIFTIFLEDLAGMIGTVLAFLGIFLGNKLHKPYLDPAASILIGLLLGSVAVLLARETGALLVGERTNRAKIRKIRQIISGDASVERILELLTMQLGPQQALLTAKVKFREPLNLPQLESAIARIKALIRKQEPTMEKIFIEAHEISDVTKNDARAA